MSASDQNTAFGIRIACPDCGGALVYDIEAASMRCLNCGNKKNVTDLPDPTKDAGEMDIPYWDYSLDGEGKNLGDARSRRPGRRPGPGAADRRGLHALFVPSAQRVPHGNTA